MSFNNSRFNRHLSSPLSHNYAAQNLARLQSDLASTVRIWAVDEVSATIMHQINEPLTALLLYLHEIKEDGERSGDGESDRKSRQDIVERALRETERLCEIMEQMDSGFEAPVETNVAITDHNASIVNRRGGRSAKGIGTQPSATRPCSQEFLTPREREVLALVTEGTTSKEGANALGISSRTFEVHRAHIMAKLGARNSAELVRMVLSEGR